MIYDTAVIGTGPAGLSAVLNLKIHKKNIIWLGSRHMSDKVSKAECISNYPGFPNVSGQSLNESFQTQADVMGLEITEQMVNEIIPMGTHYALMAGSEFYEAKTIILATGVAAASVLEGEAALLGAGVSYCATCDGNLYEDRIIAVICNAARFEHEVSYLAELAAKVYYLPAYKDVSVHAGNIEIIREKPAAVTGEKRADGVKLRNGEILSVDGVFCLRDSIALSSLLPGLETEEGHIAVDRQLATNLPGIYAAGDCTGRPYQYAKAVGEGNVAAHSVIAYLAETGKTP